MDRSHALPEKRIFPSQRSFRRNTKGASQMAEFGPALFILIIVIVIPLINFVYLGYAYAVGWYCNQMLLREVTCGLPPTTTTGTPPNQTTSFAYRSGPPGQDIEPLIETPTGVLPASPQNLQLFADLNVHYTTWLNSMARLCHGVQNHCYLYQHMTTQTINGVSTNYIDYSILQSVITVTPLFPFISLSWFENIPGLGANVTFQYASQGVQEEKGLN